VTKTKARIARRIRIKRTGERMEAAPVEDIGGGSSRGKCVERVPGARGGLSRTEPELPSKRLANA
jgi:hypothetical protein